MVAVQLLVAATWPAASGMIENHKLGHLLLQAQALLQTKLDDDDEAFEIQLPSTRTSVPPAVGPPIGERRDTATRCSG